VRCVAGEIPGMIVDICLNSPIYGKHVAVDLLGSYGQIVLIGDGSANDCVSLEDGSADAY